MVGISFDNTDHGPCAHCCQLVQGEVSATGPTTTPSFTQFLLFQRVPLSGHPKHRSPASPVGPEDNIFRLVLLLFCYLWLVWITFGKTIAA